MSPISKAEKPPTLGVRRVKRSCKRPPCHEVRYVSPSDKTHRPALMDEDSKVERIPRTPQPDGSVLLELDPDAERFFKAETKIQDSVELRKHIIEVQEEAYQVSRRPPDRTSHMSLATIYFTQLYPYPCIRGFRFAKPKIARMPAYPRVFRLLGSRPDAVFLDIGCCSTDRFPHLMIHFV